MKPESTWTYARCFYPAKEENLSSRLSEQRELRQRQSAGPHTPNWSPAQQTRRGGGAEESKGKPTPAGGCGMALRALWHLWLLGCCWCCGSGRGAGPGATFARPGPRSRERQAAAFRVPTARLPVCLSPCLFLCRVWAGAEGSPRVATPGGPLALSFATCLGFLSWVYASKLLPFPTCLDLTLSLSYAFANRKIFFQERFVAVDLWCTQSNSWNMSKVFLIGRSTPF